MQARNLSRLGIRLKVGGICYFFGEAYIPCDMCRRLLAHGIWASQKTLEEERRSLWGSPLGGRRVAGLMIEGEAKPPIKRGFASAAIGKPAGWAGGLREEQEDGGVEDNF